MKLFIRVRKMKMYKRGTYIITIQYNIYLYIVMVTIDFYRSVVTEWCSTSLFMLCIFNLMVKFNFVIALQAVLKRIYGMLMKYSDLPLKLLRGKSLSLSYCSLVHTGK